MSNIRRYDALNRPIFMTAVCYKRKTRLKGDAAKELLLSVMREIKQETSYTMLGYIILDDHFHWMIRLAWRNENGLSGNPPAANTLTYDQAYDSVGNKNHERGVLSSHDDLNSKYAISKIMQSLKLRFTYRYKKNSGIRSNVSLWQRRFWDHIVKDQEDFNRHLDYIHYNPVKHGYVVRPIDYSFSSFPEYVERGVYGPGWGEEAEPMYLSKTEWE